MNEPPKIMQELALEVSLTIEALLQLDTTQVEYHRDTPTPYFSIRYTYLADKLFHHGGVRSTICDGTIWVFPLYVRLDEDGSMDVLCNAFETYQFQLYKMYTNGFANRVRNKLSVMHKDLKIERVIKIGKLEHEEESTNAGKDYTDALRHTESTS